MYTYTYTSTLHLCTPTLGTCYDVGEDLSAELGATGSRNPKTGEYLDVFKHARLQTLLAAKVSLPSRLLPVSIMC